MKLLWSAKSKIIKDKNGENVPHLEITEVVLVYFNIFNSVYHKLQESCVHFYQQIIWSIIRYFNQKFYKFKIFWFRIFIYWSMIYWSKFSTARERR